MSFEEKEACALARVYLWQKQEVTVNIFFSDVEIPSLKEEHQRLFSTSLVKHHSESRPTAGDDARLLAPIGGLMLLPSVSANSEEIWLTHFDRDVRSVYLSEGDWMAHPFEGLFPRWTCKYNPTDLENMPSVTPVSLRICHITLFKLFAQTLN